MTELFERLKCNWKSNLEKKINYDNLKRFDSEKKIESVLEKQVGLIVLIRLMCLSKSFNKVFYKNLGF